MKIILLLSSAKLIQTYIKYFSGSCEVSSTMKPVKPPPGSAEISHLLRTGLLSRTKSFYTHRRCFKEDKENDGVVLLQVNEHVSVYLNSIGYFKSHYSQHNV